MRNSFKILFCLLVLLCLHTIVHAQYNFYFGTLHAHSAYSDGNKDSITSLMTTPFEDFEYAKLSLNMNFLGISDHNHIDAGMRLLNYQKGIQQANLTTVNGSFVSLYGMEWGEIATGGHVLIYGFDSLIGWDTNNYEVFNAQSDYTGLFAKIANHPGAFAYLAHPTTSDFNGLYTATYNPVSDKAIIGSPFRSGPAFSTNFTYSNPSTGNYLNRFYDGLKKGYHLGIGLDHDTHYSVFGRSQEGRTVALATSLTQASILDAFRNRRFYASDDWNAKVNFTIQSFPLGSIATGFGNPNISISVVDPDGEAISDISIFCGVPGSGITPALLTSVAGSLNLNYTDVLLKDSSTRYYFARIQQGDGDQIYTSPIWYTRFDAIGITETTRSEVNSFTLTPNPATGNFIVSFTTPFLQDLQLEIFNSSGQLIQQQQIKQAVGAYAERMQLKNAPPGIYLIRLSSGTGAQTRRIILE